jgi:hypothetical protein
MKIAIILLAVVAAFIWGYNVSSLTPRIYTTDNDAVKSVCDYSHNYQGIKGAGEWEQACGLAQDATNTEYLCDKTLTTCWVENK